MTEQEASFTHKEPCPECGSRDNLARYTDGHGWCFGCGHYEHGDGTVENRRPPVSSDLIEAGQVVPLAKRNISEKTAQLFGYTKSTFNGKNVQVAAYRDESNRVVAQKLRFANKDFLVRGNLSEALPLWGQQLWRDGGKFVVVTEGEIDAMSVSQAQGNKWPVVSVPNGAQGAAKAVGKAIAWLLGFDHIVFMFDDDEPGRDAALECAALMPPGRAKIAKLHGYKDANEALVDHKKQEIIDALWGAAVWRPDGVVHIEDLIEQACEPVVVGYPWWLETMTNWTYGRRPGEVYGFGAGTGIGKTDFFTQQAVFDAHVLKEKVGMIYLEMPPVELTRRMAGKVGHKMFHLPDRGGVANEDLRASVLALKGMVSIYDHFGETDWNVIAQRIRYMVQAEGIKMIYLDHLTAMADPADERGSLELIMKEMASLAQELKCIIHFVSHLATPDGTPHEEGGRVTIRHFKGSRAIGFWSYFMFGLERDQQHEDLEKRKLTTLRCLKDRYTGTGTGQTLLLSYDTKTGLLYETDDMPEEDEFGMGDEEDNCPF